MKKREEYKIILASQIDTKILANFWKQIVVDGVAKMTFYETMPKDEMFFCDWAKNENICCVFSQNDAENIRAIYWLNNPLGKAIMIHFCFCKHAFSEQKEIGDLVVRELLFTQTSHEESNNGFAIDTLMGITPKVYRHALKFIESLGFQKGCILKNACYFSEKQKYSDGIVSTLTRENIF